VKLLLATVLNCRVPFTVVVLAVAVFDVDRHGILRADRDPRCRCSAQTRCSTYFGLDQLPVVILLIF